ncbi:hypothetical protein EDF46_0071 [Frondihabitans sp. PhB188]|uniref:hypothetical protein n=1 Tax=Frondihabitans sp. PhB188 TaxID=2485200 RepID=UPI000F461386|nr:hypothetical protein [Frondihabitans sp. PhB188]ROQ40711.1 hypothetical protein EDF46_0071 [Frondihabitans sp. PhB188]
MSSITPDGGRHLALGEIVRLVPIRSGYTPQARTGFVAPSALARHAAALSLIGAVAALAGTSATAVALMLGLGR